jgi:putative protease
MTEQEIGVVTHYFDQPGVAVIKVTAGELAVGDKIRLVGRTSDFTEQVTSMEVDHEKVERATEGHEVAVKVIERARVHDRVLKLG